MSAAHDRGRDIWLRARTNAFAHQVTAERLGQWSIWMASLQAFFICAAIILVGLSLSALANQGTPLPSRMVPWLPIIAIILNGGSLFISMLMRIFQWSEKRLQHDHLMAGYALIAQKARRLESREVEASEATNLVRQLEELFEAYKNMGSEPSNDAFTAAKGRLKTLNVYPFGLAAESVA